MDEIFSSDSDLVTSTPSSRTSKSKPLHLKMLDRYKAKFIIPDLENKKIELSRKHEFFKPLSHSDLLKHEIKYKDFKSRQELRRNRKSEDKNLQNEINSINLIYKSKWIQGIKNEENKLKKEEFKKEKEKKDLVLRRANYSKIVKSLYMPEVSPKSVNSEPASNKNKVNSGLAEIKELIELRPKKKHSKSIPQKIEIKENSHIDYLGMLRKERESKPLPKMKSYDLSGFLDTKDFEFKISKMQNTAKFYETQARKHENLLNNLNRSSEGAIKKSEKFGDLMVSSIRTKLAIFERIGER